MENKKESAQTKTAIVTQSQPSAEPNVEMLLTQAIDKGIPIEVMERLMNMRRELKAEQAKKYFDEDMAKFQGTCPIIKKKKAGASTNSGKVAYYYAPLDSIVSQTKELMQECGLSYSIQTSTEEKGVKAVCIVKHVAGHSESSSMSVPLGQQTNVMSAPQVTASALTFAKRYAFCDVFGILTGDDDTDAQTTPLESSKVIDEINSINSIKELEAYYHKNKGQGKEFDGWVTQRKKELNK